MVRVVGVIFLSASFSGPSSAGPARELDSGRPRRHPSDLGAAVFSAGNGCPLHAGQERFSHSCDPHSVLVAHQGCAHGCTRQRPGEWCVNCCCGAREAVDTLMNLFSDDSFSAGQPTGRSFRRSRSSTPRASRPPLCARSRSRQGVGTEDGGRRGRSILGVLRPGRGTRTRVRCGPAQRRAQIRSVRRLGMAADGRIQAGLQPLRGGRAPGAHGRRHNPPVLSGHSFRLGRRRMQPGAGPPTT